MLDIILESFENSPSMYRTFIELLKNYKSENETICQIVGFKFQSLNQKEKNIQQQQQQQQLEVTEHSKSNNNDQNDLNLYQMYHLHSKSNMLYLITSYLLKYNMIELDLLTTHVIYFL